MTENFLLYQQKRRSYNKEKINLLDLELNTLNNHNKHFVRFINNIKTMNLSSDHSIKNITLFISQWSNL